LRMLPMLALMYLFNVRLLDSCNSARSNRMTGT
jgi:hypothetical protein